MLCTQSPPARTLTDQLPPSAPAAVPQRQYTLQEIELLARFTGWEVVDVHGDFDSKIDLDHDDAYRSVVSLKRLGGK